MATPEGQIGEALAASSRDLLNFMQSNNQLALSAARVRQGQERLEQQRQRTESLAERRDLQNDINRLEYLSRQAPPGTPLAEFEPAHETFERVFGLDPKTDPRAANVKLNPLDAQDRFAQLKLDAINSAEGADRRRLLETLVLQDVDAESFAELERDEQLAMLQNTSLQRFQEQMDPRSDNFDPQLAHNIGASFADVPQQIQVLGPSGESFLVDDEIASTLTSQLWQASTERGSDRRDLIDSSAQSLVTALDNAGVSFAKPKARQIVRMQLEGVPEDDNSTLARAIGGDTEALQELDQGTRMAVQIAQQGAIRSDGVRNAFLNEMPSELRNPLTQATGLLGLLEQQVGRQRALEVANALEGPMKELAEKHGLEGQIPSFSTGWFLGLGSTSAELPQGQTPGQNEGQTTGVSGGEAPADTANAVDLLPGSRPAGADTESTGTGSEDQGVDLPPFMTELGPSDINFTADLADSVAQGAIGRREAQRRIRRRATNRSHAQNMASALDFALSGGQE